MAEDMLWVTCYCDASEKDGVSAWSIWLRSSKGRIIKSGACPPEVTNSLMAEFYAAYMGVKTACEEWEPFGVQVNSDCMNVVKGLGRNYRWSGSKGVRKLQNKILRLSARIRTKHVKAHTGGQDTRSYLNRRCDHFAKAARTGEKHEDLEKHRSTNR